MTESKINMKYSLSMKSVLQSNMRIIAFRIQKKSISEQTVSIDFI